MKKPTGTVTDRGQVTIPKRLRDRLGIRAGQTLEFEEAPGGRLIARKADDRDPAARVYGILPLTESSDDLVERLRGPADSP